MEDKSWIIHLITIAVVAQISTLIIALKMDIKKAYKYFPPAAILLGSIIYCIVLTVIKYNRYIGILYVVVLIITFPGFILTLLTAISFDIIQFVRKRKKRNVPERVDN